MSLRKAEGVLLAVQVLWVAEVLLAGELGQVLLAGELVQVLLAGELGTVLLAEVLEQGWVTLGVFQPVVAEESGELLGVVAGVFLEEIVVVVGGEIVAFEEIVAAVVASEGTVAVAVASEGTAAVAVAFEETVVAAFGETVVAAFEETVAAVVVFEVPVAFAAVLVAFVEDQ